jgi:hypothetical protein
MQIECPACKWPSLLDQQGPPEDPSILLTATASIGDAAIKIIAARVDPNLDAAPDYRTDVPKACYRERGHDVVLNTILEEFEYAAAQIGDLLGEEHLNIVELATGRYQIWVIPVIFDHAP